MKRNYQDNVSLAGTDSVTTVNSLKEQGRNLLAVKLDITDLNKKKPQNPSDFLRIPDDLKDPAGEIASIKADLRMMVKRLDDAEMLIKQNRALLAELLA